MVGKFTCGTLREHISTFTRNYFGIILDFEAYIAQTNDEKRKAERQAWIKALRLSRGGSGGSVMV